MIKRLLLKFAVIVIVVVMIYTCFFIHEYGHLRAMQSRSVEVQEFALGMGPKIVGWNSGEYEFSIRLIPIGAYVAPSEKGVETMKNLSKWDNFLISSAGIRNNLVVALTIVIGVYFSRALRQGLNFNPIGKVLWCFWQLVKLSISSLFDFLTFSWFDFERPKPFDIGKGIILSNIFIFNLVLAIFNILPLYPLDGGRIFSLVFHEFFSQSFWEIWQALGFPLLMILFVLGRVKTKLVSR